MTTVANPAAAAPFPAAEVGAAMVRALAAVNDRPNPAIVEAVTEMARMVENAGDTATARWITDTFMIARELHTNFYENELTEYIVIGGLMQCEELSELLYRRFGAAV